MYDRFRCLCALPGTLLLLGGATLSTQSARGADWSRPVEAAARGRGFFSAQRAQDSFSSVVLGALELVPRAAGTGSTTSRLSHDSTASIPPPGRFVDREAAGRGLEQRAEHLSYARRDDLKNRSGEMIEPRGRSSLPIYCIPDLPSLVRPSFPSGHLPSTTPPFAWSKTLGIPSGAVG